MVAFFFVVRVPIWLVAAVLLFVLIVYLAWRIYKNGMPK
jgi:hypothetical protein